MDPITLITTAAIAGSIAIGNKLVEKSTEHVWDTFMARLRGKAEDDAEASKALATVDDPHAVRAAVQATNAAADPELVRLAQQLNGALPQQQVQIAKNIFNIERVDTQNFY